MVPRPLTITEYETLLGRPARVFQDRRVRAVVGGRRVLVTGAGGSLGGELCRAIAGMDPAHLVMLGHGEEALYRIDLELREACPAVHRTAVLADVRDSGRLARFVQDYRPDVIFHAAAVKHVPLAEEHPCEAVLTNVVGTLNLLTAARLLVPTVVLISTDKAVSPVGVMGKTKRVAEMLFQDAGPGRRVIRLGNVLGASGSIVPLFDRQLSSGRPLTVTHPEIARYFIAPREAIALMLQVLAVPEQADAVYVLDMGDPVRVADLARRLALIRGKPDAEIEYTALRPGEKLDEALFHPWEDPRQAYACEGIRVGTMRAHGPGLYRAVGRLADAARHGHQAETLAELDALVRAGEPSP